MLEFRKRFLRIEPVLVLNRAGLFIRTANSGSDATGEAISSSETTTVQLAPLPSPGLVGRQTRHILLFDHPAVASRYPS